MITLGFPPGAENTALGESGVSIANTVNSVFWNPANAACLYEGLYVNNIYTKFREALLPSLDIPDLYHDFTAFSTTLENVLPFIDIGYAYFKNHIDMGMNTLYSDIGEVIDSVHSTETVISNTIALRIYDIFSIGASFKTFDSRLAPGMGGDEFPEDGIARGHAFDLGIRINKKFDFPGLFYINPSLGVSGLNLGNDSADYVDTSSRKDPLPRKGIIGAACEVNFLELAGYTFVYEMDFNLLTKPKERTRHCGHKIQITPFCALLFGTMADAAGKRFEKTSGYVWSFNYRKTMALTGNIIKLLDRLNNTDRFAKFTAWDNSLNFHGFEFKPNVHISKSRSTIYESEPTRVRLKQTREDLSVGIGILAGFPDIRKKRSTTEVTGQEKKEKSVVIEEKDGELIEE